MQSEFSLTAYHILQIRSEQFAKLLHLKGFQFISHFQQLKIYKPIIDLNFVQSQISSTNFNDQVTSIPTTIICKTRTSTSSRRNLVNKQLILLKGLQKLLTNNIELLNDHGSIHLHYFVYHILTLIILHSLVTIHKLVEKVVTRWLGFFTIILTIKEGYSLLLTHNSHIPSFKISSNLYFIKDFIMDNIEMYLESIPSVKNGYNAKEEFILKAMSLHTFITDTL